MYLKKIGNLYYKLRKLGFKKESVLVARAGWDDETEEIDDTFPFDMDYDKAIADLPTQLRGKPEGVTTQVVNNQNPKYQDIPKDPDPTGEMPNIFSIEKDHPIRAAVEKFLDIAYLDCIGSSDFSISVDDEVNALMPLRYYGPDLKPIPEDKRRDPSSYIDPAQAYVMLNRILKQYYSDRRNSLDFTHFKCLKDWLIGLTPMQSDSDTDKGVLSLYSDWYYDNVDNRGLEEELTRNIYRTDQYAKDIDRDIDYLLKNKNQLSKL